MDSESWIYINVNELVYCLPFLRQNPLLDSEVVLLGIAPSERLLRRCTQHTVQPPMRRSTKETKVNQKPVKQTRRKKVNDKKNKSRMMLEELRFKGLTNLGRCLLWSLIQAYPIQFWWAQKALYRWRTLSESILPPKMLQETREQAWLYGLKIARRRTRGRWER